MSYVTINGRDYQIPKVTFDTICKLEESGISMLELASEKKPKIALLSRAFVAWILDVEPEQASEAIQEHIRNGGNIIDILDKVYEAIAEAGFFGQNAGQEQAGQVAQIPNREQRRRNRKNYKRNMEHSQRS